MDKESESCSQNSGPPPSTDSCAYPLPDAMKTFLYTPGLLDEPKASLEDEILMQEDNSLKFALLKLVKTLLSLRESCEMKDSPTAKYSLELREKVGHSLRRVNLLRDSYIWEHLNIGHWKSVDPGWRRAYTFLCICKTIFMAVMNTSYKDIVKECDMGLLMGEPILRNVLLSFVQDLSKLIREKGQEELETNISDLGQEQGQGQIAVVAFEKVCLKMQHPESRFEILSIGNPSLEQFADIMQEQRPILISDGIEHWPARKKWSVDYLRKTVGFRTVPVEIGSKYTSDDWTQKIMTIDEFINSFMNRKDHEPNRGVGYVAQHRLFDQITELGEDIKIPDYCLLGKSKEVDINAWFGPGNTISPMHYDPKHNILVQVFGTKLIRLYPSTESHYLNPFPSSSLLFNTSQIDLEDSSVLDKYPDLKNARYCEFLLQPGFMLYMPPKWWHYVKSLTPSFSVSFWFE